MQILVIICLFTKIVGCVCRVTLGTQTVGCCIQVRTTNPHHTVDLNGMRLKITTYSCIKLKYYISQLFLLKILDHVTQIYSKIINSFYALLAS